MNYKKCHSSDYNDSNSDSEQKREPAEWWTLASQADNTVELKERVKERQVLKPC